MHNYNVFLLMGSDKVYIRKIVMGGHRSKEDSEAEAEARLKAIYPCTYHNLIIERELK